MHRLGRVTAALPTAAQQGKAYQPQSAPGLESQLGNRTNRRDVIASGWKCYESWSLRALYIVHRPMPTSASQPTDEEKDRTGSLISRKAKTHYLFGSLRLTATPVKPF